MLFVLVLVVYAIYRMHVAGVNLASIVTTSAVLAGGDRVLAAGRRSATCGAASRCSSTTRARLGDWVRIENVTGQIVDIRWRYVAIATNSGETVIVPNSTLMKNRVTVLARRGDQRIPWRREVEFQRLVRRRAEPGDRCRRKAR